MKTKPKNESVVYVSGREPEYQQSLSLDIIRTKLPAVYAPEDVIHQFWEKYHPMQSQFRIEDFMFCAHMFANRLRPYVCMTKAEIKEFHKDLDSLVRATYFLNRYAKRRKKLVIKKGEEPDTTKSHYKNIIKSPV